MEPENQIKKFGDFLEKVYKTDLLESIRKGRPSIALDFSELVKFEPDLADQLLEHPEDTIKSVEIALDNFDLGDKKKKPSIRFKNLPESQTLLIRNIRSAHLNKFFQMNGIIRQKSDVRPQVTSAKFECPSCGNIISLLQTDKKFKEPSRCGCGRKGKFRLLSKALIDAQGIVLEEDPGDLEGGEQPKRINVLMKDDLVSPMTEKRTNPGSKVCMTGMIKEVPLTGRDGTQLTRFDIILECNYVEAVQEDFYEIEISEEEEQKIKEIAQDPNCMTKLVASIAPSIFGYDKVKEALLVQLVGGVRKVRSDGMITRGDMHVLLIGDPGAGKCLAPDSKIMLSDGSIEKIKDLFQNNKNQFIEQDCYSAINPIHVSSVSITGKAASMISEKLWRRKSPKYIIQITTASGSIIETTEEHPFFTTEQALVLPISAKDLGIGDYIACPRKIVIDTPIQFLPKIKKYSPANNRVKFNVPEVFDERFARFLGYLIGDGYVRYRKTTGIISLTNKDLLILKDFENITKQLFNIRVKKRNKQKTETQEYYFSSIDFLKFMESIDQCIIKDSGNVRIPRICQKSPDHILRHFIMALFECEAHISPRDIQFTSKSKDLVEQLKMSLLRFAIQSQISPKIKYATNTISKTRRKYYELRISGSDIVKYMQNIGFLSEKKAAKLKISAVNKKRNPNLDIIPNVNPLLKNLRNRYNHIQKMMGIPRTTFMHYERNDRNPSRESLRKIVKQLKTINPDDFDVIHLDLISNSDIFWDRIKDIKTINSEFDYVYDIEVNSTHNFVANAVTVHNSQLLKRVSKVAPKARYVSGKGVSGAGLCVDGDSLVMTNPGEVTEIKQIVEKNIKDNIHEHLPGIYKTQKVQIPKNVFSINSQGVISPKEIEDYWKIKAPETLIKIKTQSGKEIKATARTKLCTISNADLIWQESANFKVGDYLATSRRIPEINTDENLFLLDLIDTQYINPTMYGIKSNIKEIKSLLVKKYGSLRDAAKKLDIKENNIYHAWAKEDARGNIDLKTLRKLAQETDYDLKKLDHLELSLYKGHKITIPKNATPDFMYFAGLIAGDGDLSKGKNSTTIRFSNSDEFLLQHFEKLSSQLFNAKVNISSSESSKRPKSLRFSSKIVVQILNKIGIPHSPKSHLINPSDDLLKLPNIEIASFIRAVFDCDGSVVQRKTRGSSYVELTTTSERLAKKFQLMLQRFSIYASLREKVPAIGRIKFYHQKFILEIRGKANLVKFQENISFFHREKKRKLQEIIDNIGKSNTNIDIVPNIQNSIIKLKEKYKIRSKDLFGYKKSSANLISSQISRNYLKKIVSKLSKFISYDKVLESLSNLSVNDIFWDKIISVEEIGSQKEYVYDLTVKKSHNFLVNGIIVHNTASVVKDEFLNGWALEAGALPLSNKGMCMIDEMDKMTVEDRSAMHEALEQQCFHYNTIFQFADGSEEKVGDFVENLFNKYPEKVIHGKDCFILKLPKFEKQLLTTDWNKIFPAKIDRISKHIATKEFIEITISNGRRIIVTPEHPVFCIEEGRIFTKRADAIDISDWIPVPLNLPISGTVQFFSASNVFNHRSSQHIVVPMHNDKNFFKIVGYMLAEGSKEINRGKLIGINFTNNDSVLLDDFRHCMAKVFHIQPYAQNRRPSTIMLRYISRELAAFIKEEVPEIIEKAPDKVIPQLCMKGSKQDISAMLCCMFEGDGHVSRKLRTIRIGYASNSRRMCEQVQDLLLRFGIRSNLTEHKLSYKVSITGYDNLLKFHHHIGFKTRRKVDIIKEYLNTKKGIRTVKDLIPNCQNVILHALEKNNIRIVGKNTIAAMKQDYLKKKKNISRVHFQKALGMLKQKGAPLNHLDFSEIGFEKVKNVKRIKNNDQKYTYDITIEPDHAFVSQNQILHNTISISKANIQATLRCETTVLAAANPKFGRFDPYDIIASQINLPPALINRFDLIFTIKDMPDYDKDERMAMHILNLHQNPDVEEPDIDTEILKKYIAYARRTRPLLTEAAIEEIKKYYVDMRNKDNEGDIKSVPISARQLEALVRLSEGVAKTRLGEKVTRKDAKRGIELMHYCLSQIGVDPETGKIDIDRIATGITASQRSHIMGIKEIINELESRLGKTIPIEDIVKEASEKGIDAETVDEAIEKLKRSGDIFEPKRGFVAKI